MIRVGAASVGALLLWACDGGPLDPTVTRGGLTFFGDVELLSVEATYVAATLGVRNDATERIERTLAGGCFVVRMQLLAQGGGDPRLVWDSDDRNEPHACTDDLVLLDLAPGESAMPPTWGFAAALEELQEAAVPPGTYIVALWFELDERLARVAVGEVRVPAIGDL